MTKRTIRKKRHKRKKSYKKKSYKIRTQKKKKRKRKQQKKKRFYIESNNLKGRMISLPTSKLKYTEVEPNLSVYNTNVLKRAIEKGNIKVLRRFIENME